jgi:uncharacterized protein
MATTAPSTQAALGTSTQRAPAYRITLDGKDLTNTFKPRLISLSLSQARDGEADQLDITLDDADGQLQLPRTGVAISLAIGWAGSALVSKGDYTVDEAEHSGAPDQIQIRARSADLRSSLRTRTEQSWHNTTLGTVAHTIAGRNGLVARIDPALASVPIAHVDQTNESDINFISRLGSQYDAVATVKAGRLLLLPINGTRTSAGAALPTLTVTRASGDQHRYHQADREAYSGVRAYWHDPARAKQRSVLVGRSGNAKRLRESHATEADARAAAEAEWQRIERGAATFELLLATGLPSAEAQTPLTVSGFKPQIDGSNWLVTKVTHNISDSGFTTRLEAELQGADSSAGDAQDVGE